MRKLILGTVQMGIDYGINNNFGKISIEDSHEILLTAHSAGITTLDTAEAYGNAHQVIGDYHKKNPNSLFRINTKVPHTIKAQNIESKVNEYIAILGIKCIEVLMFHSFESFIDNKEAINVLNKLKNKGLIKHIGVSVYTNKQLEYLKTIDSIAVIQLPFNLLDNLTIRGKLLQELKDKNKIIHTRSVFLQGLFFKNHNEDKKLHKEIEVLNTIAINANCSMEELALSYCLQQQNIDNVIIGVDSLAHLVANLRASTYIIKEDTLEYINAIKVKDLNSLNPSLWE